MQNEKQKCILLVDDSRAVLAKLSQMLIAFQYRVVTTTSAIDALQLVRTERPDCIISDYEMPDITGPEFCETIKADPDLREIPIVLLTSKDDAESIIEGISRGADDFMNKTIGAEILKVKIDAMLRLKAMRDEIVSLKRLHAVNALVVTYNHEINNALMIAMGINHRIQKNVNSHQEDFKKVNDALLRIKEVVAELSKLEKIEEVDYVDNGRAKMIAFKKASGE